MAGLTPKSPSDSRKRFGAYQELCDPHFLLSVTKFFIKGYSLMRNGTSSSVNPGILGVRNFRLLSWCRRGLHSVAPLRGVLILVYLLTAVGLTPGGSSTVHIYTQTIHRKTQQQTTQLTTFNWEQCGPCPLFAPSGICFTTEEKAWRSLSQRSRRVPVGTMKTEYTEQSVHHNKNIWFTKLNRSIQNTQQYMQC